MSARGFVSGEEQKAITTAIAAAETKTSAEVVCAVATESGRYDRAEAVVGLLVALVGLWAVNTFGAGGAGEVGAWTEPSQLPLLWQLGAAVGGFVVGNVLASYVHPLRRLLVRSSEIDAEVARTASHVFMSKRLTSTRGGGGVLVYVSLFERRVVVLADQGAFAVLGQAGVDALRDGAVAKLHEGDRVGTFVSTIESVADRLAEALPCAANDANELSNELLVYHPRP